MKKDDAKAFLQSRKDQYSGRVDRDLGAKVDFTIVKNKLERVPYNAQSCVEIKITAHIKISI